MLIMNHIITKNNISREGKIMNSTQAKIKAGIIYIIAAAICFTVVSFLGYAKHYDDTYVSSIFEKRKKQIPELTEAQSTFNKRTEEKSALNAEVSDIKKTVDSVLEFEKNQETYTSELQELYNQIEILSAQKVEKEQTLNDIEYELSQY